MIRKTLIVLATSAAFAAPAFAAPTTFEFEGRVWTIPAGTGGRPFDPNQMTPNAHISCPTLNIKLESRGRNAGATPMSQEGRERGDKRKHISCIFEVSKPRR